MVPAFLRHARSPRHSSVIGGAVRSAASCGAVALLVLAGCRKADADAAAKSAAPTATAASPASAPAASAPNSAATKTAQVPEPVRKLMGRWLRADGGYVLELKQADVSGVIEAAYFNPKSIHVSRAIWMQGPMGFQVMVELNDVGYPGATYVLTHDAQNDRLVGQYNQPAMQQSFDIEFVRQPR